MHPLTIPSESIDECGFCVSAGGAFHRECRGCVVRWTSRLMRNQRAAIYKAAKEQHGEEGMRAFMTEVRAYWEAERERDRLARLEQHRQGIQAAKRVLS